MSRLLASLLLLAVVSAAVLKTPTAPAGPAPSDLAEPSKEVQEERTPRLKRQYYGYGGYNNNYYPSYGYGYNYPSYSYNSYPSYNSYYSYPSYSYPSYSYYSPYSYYG